MAWQFDGVRIESVAIVDDNEDARLSMHDELSDSAVEPRIVRGQYFEDAEKLVTAARDEADAAIFDHHLSTYNFARCSGAEAVAVSYDQQFPAVLITAYSNADIDGIRRFRRRVPALLTPEQADPDSIQRAFEVCVLEFKQHFLPSRKPMKTLVRVEDVDLEPKMPIVYAIVTAWNSEEVVRFPLDVMPERLRSRAIAGARFYAVVNIGAESQTDLYLEQFEFRA